MVQAPVIDDIAYPESDGQPMADNTKQYRWIVRLTENLKHLFAGRDVFVAADLLWYPVKGNPKVVAAPDVLVVIGRPGGDRGSYLQWMEDDLAPQVVFEIISPSNRASEVIVKQSFYRQHRVLEMFFYDPDSYEFWGLVRRSPEDELLPISGLNLPWVSPVLGIRFELQQEGLVVYHPDGRPFKDYGEVAQERDRAVQERDRALAKLQELGLTLSPQP